MGDESKVFWAKVICSQQRQSYLYDTYLDLIGVSFAFLFPRSWHSAHGPWLYGAYCLEALNDASQTFCKPIGREVAVITISWF